MTKLRTCHVSREWGLLAESDTIWLQSCAARTTSANAKWSKADVTLYDPSVLGSAPSKALKALVRQGIPDDLRPDLWLLFSGGLAKKRAAPPGHYALLLRKTAQGASGVCCLRPRVCVRVSLRCMSLSEISLAAFDARQV